MIIKDEHNYAWHFLVTCFSQAKRSIIIVKHQQQTLEEGP